MKKTIITALLAIVVMTGWAQRLQVGELNSEMSKIGTLADTYWRNEQTGAWDIGFTEQCAIYDCRLWDYSDVKQKGDKFEMMLTNNGESLKVSVGKQKDGKRQMTIETGGKGQEARSKKQTYSQITTGELPNYPTKDLTPFEQFLKVDSFPTYKLIDKQGTIHDLHWLHADDMSSFLETIDKMSK